MICVAVPETGKLKTKIHLGAASVMSVSVLVQLAVILVSTELPVAAQIVCGIGLLAMLAIWIILIAQHRIKRYELALQSVYFLCYLGSIIFIEYISNFKLA